jgi:hypothetical protein
VEGQQGSEACTIIVLPRYLLACCFSPTEAHAAWTTET